MIVGSRHASRSRFPPHETEREKRALPGRNPRPNHDDQLKILGPDDAVALLRQAVPDDQHEGEIVLGLDWASQLCGIATRFPERDGPVPEICVEHLRLIAEELAAVEILLVTFVPPDRVVPTAADVARFEGLRVECGAEHVALVDHVLMAGHQWRSIAELTPLLSRRRRDWSGGDPSAWDHGA